MTISKRKVQKTQQEFDDRKRYSPYGRRSDYLTEPWATWKLTSTHITAHDDPERPEAVLRTRNRAHTQCPSMINNHVCAWDGTLSAGGRARRQARCKSSAVCQWVNSVAYIARAQATAMAHEQRRHYDYYCRDVGRCWWCWWRWLALSASWPIPGARRSMGGGDPPIGFEWMREVVGNVLG